MFRPLALALLILPVPAFADVLRAQAPVRAVTLYPEGASVTRTVRLEAPAGSHSLVVPGLPADTDASALRLEARGAEVAGVSLQTDRALPGDGAEPQAVTAARAEVRRLEQALRARDAAVAAIRARVEAAEAAIAVLKGLADAEGAGRADIGALAAGVEGEVLRARQAAIAAETEAAAASEGREDLVAALDRARAALEAVMPPEGAQAALVIALTTAGGPVEIDVTGVDPRAGWQPVYDMRLDRTARSLRLDRAAVVRQATGEDWTGVTLTLSTARPSEGGTPSPLEPEFVSIAPEGGQRDAMLERAEAPMAAAPMTAAVEAAPRFDGITLVFDYPRPVDIRSGADALRLTLGSIPLGKTEVRAEAVPLRDTRATLIAEAVNGAEVILPGTATLFSGGVMTGRAELPLTAGGETLRLGFGPIDGLTVERRIEAASAGGRGMLGRAEAAVETARLIVTNHTPEAWPLRVIDRVPVSGQDDLTVTWTADPAPGTTDPDGRRGVLVWDSEIAAGAEQSIRLTTELRWPAGQVLLR